MKPSHSVLKTLLHFLLALLTSLSANAQLAGELDLSFDPGTSVFGEIRAMAMQADGKIIIGGRFTSYNGVPRNHIARLHPDGTLDPSFDPGAGPDNEIATLAIQTDGRIVAGGAFTSYNGTPRNRLVRLLGDGSLDASFNPGTGANNIVSTIALQADGKLIIGGGFITYNNIIRMFITRLNPDGTIDAGFNAGGTGTENWVFATAVSADGKIIIGGGFGSYDNTYCPKVARLHTNGTLDAGLVPELGSGGLVSAVAVQADGKIVIGGTFGNPSNTSRYFIARLNADGTLDQSFASGTGPDSFVRALAIQSDGKILAGGEFTSYDGISRGYIARLNADGSPDAGFNAGTGASSTGTAGGVYAIALQPDGKVLIGGIFYSYNGVARRCIARIGGGTAAAVPDVNSTKLSIFPNPSTGKLTLQFAEESSLGTGRAELYNLLGQLVYAANITDKAEAVLNLEGLPQGQYALYIRLNEQVLVKQVLLQR